MVMEADPEAIPRSRASPKPIPAWIRMSGELFCTPTSRQNVPVRGSTIHWHGALGVPMLSRKSISERRTMSMVEPMSSERF